MSTVTFTPKQVREIRRRIKADVPRQDYCGRGQCVAYITDILAAFPLPKRTEFNTFTVSWFGVKPDIYRINGDCVEYRAGDEWAESTFGGGSLAGFATDLVHDQQWTALAEFAKVCENPTREVDA